MASIMAREFITVASMPIWSAVVLSIFVPCLPRQKLPPPITKPTSTPMLWICTICSTTGAITSWLRPKRWSPARASPESFNKILLYLGCMDTFSSICKVVGEWKTSRIYSFYLLYHTFVKKAILFCKKFGENASFFRQKSLYRA